MEDGIRLPCWDPASLAVLIAASYLFDASRCQLPRHRVLRNHRSRARDRNPLQLGGLTANQPTSLPKHKTPNRYCCRVSLPPPTCYKRELLGREVELPWGLDGDEGTTGLGYLGEVVSIQPCWDAGCNGVKRRTCFLCQPFNIPARLLHVFKVIESKVYLGPRQTRVSVG